MKEELSVASYAMPHALTAHFSAFPHISSNLIGSVYLSGFSWVGTETTMVRGAGFELATINGKSMVTEPSVQ